MPFPAAEDVRAAVEQAIAEGLDTGDDWIAEDRANGNEYEFRPAREFEVTCSLDDDELAALDDNDPAEKTYRFRIRVELVPDAPEGWASV